MYGMTIGLMGTTAGIACACFAEQLLNDWYGPDYHARLGWRGYAIIGTALVGSSLLSTRVLLWLGSHAIPVFY
jgi:hypothetical protein